MYSCSSQSSSSSSAPWETSIPANSLMSSESVNFKTFAGFPLMLGIPNLSVVPKDASPCSQAHSRSWPMVAFSEPLNSQCPVISEKQLRTGIIINVKINVFFILNAEVN